MLGFREDADRIVVVVAVVVVVFVYVHVRNRRDVYRRRRKTKKTNIELTGNIDHVVTDAGIQRPVNTVYM